MTEFQVFTTRAMDALRKNIKDGLCRLRFLQKRNLAILFERCLTSTKKDTVCPLSRIFHRTTEGWNWPVFRSSNHSCSLTFCRIALLLLLEVTSLEFSDSLFTFFLSCLCLSLFPPLSYTYTHTPSGSSFFLAPPAFSVSALPSCPWLTDEFFIHTLLGAFSIFVALATTSKQKVKDQSSSLVWKIFTKFKHSISKCLLGHCYWLIITEITRRQQIDSSKVIFIISTTSLFLAFHQCVVRIAIIHPIIWA